MAEYVPTKLLIGGEVTNIQLDEIYEGLRLDAGINTDFFSAAKEKAIKEGVLEISLDEVAAGEFPATEYLLFKEGIPFDRQHDSYSEIPGENASFRPGMKVVLINYLDSYGDKIIDRGIVEEALQVLSKDDGTAIAGYPKLFMCKRVKMAHDILKRALGTDVEPLPKFSVID